MNKLFRALIFLTLLVLLPASVVCADVIIADDFSSDTISADNRLRLNSGPDWVRFTGSDWEVVGGVLTNPSVATNNVGEGALLRVFDVGDAALPDYDELTFSFDYNVGTGSTLFFHANGLFDGTTLAGNTQLHNTGATNGNIQSQFDDAPTSQRGDFTGINLRNGTATSGTGGSAVSLTGSGTFIQTISLTDPAFSGIDSINDLQFITLGFASNVTQTDGAGAISLDNFVFSATAAAVPEPGSCALFLGGLASLATLRRRRRTKS